MPKRKKRLDDLKKWRIEMLAKFGGFSRRYIASVVFGNPFEVVPLPDIACVSRHLHNSNIQLKNWRNGKSPVASAYARDVSKPKKDVKKRFIVSKRKKVA